MADKSEIDKNQACRKTAIVNNSEAGHILLYKGIALLYIGEQSVKGDSQYKRRDGGTVKSYQKRNIYAVYSVGDYVALLVKGYEPGRRKAAYDNKHKTNLSESGGYSKRDILVFHSEISFQDI